MVKRGSIALLLLCAATAWGQAVELPFFDDFATGQLDTSLWEPHGGATVSFDVSPQAPTVGVATLDALTANGQLYALASPSLFPADTLCSRPVRTDHFSLADSVQLTFYYLPSGGGGDMWMRMGDAPDGQDSLILDFYSPADSTWQTVWARGGTSVDSLLSTTGTDWQKVTITLSDSRYFDSLFRFRFRNYASLDNAPKTGMMGNCDMWHIDYVQMDRAADIHTHDVGFAAPAPSMLNTYRAMPWRQFAASDMADHLNISIFNLHTTDLATHYTYMVTDVAGVEHYAYDGGFENAPAQGQQTATAHAHPTASLGVASLNAPTVFEIVHTLREGTYGDSRSHNDTIRYRQVFADYYAYDDGTAENGYGTSSTSSQTHLAYRFDLRIADTLTAVDLYFNPTYEADNEAVPFYITVWADANGEPGEVLYADAMRRYPVPGSFKRYILESPVVVSGRIYVGFEQSDKRFVNLGFDRSLNTADRIFYLTGTGWQQSILAGSLMLRPCFGSAAAVGIEQTQPAQVSLYPNPTAGLLFVQDVPDGSHLILYNMQGQCVARHRTPVQAIDLSALPVGVYLLRIECPQQPPQHHKIILQR